MFGTVVEFVNTHYTCVTDSQLFSPSVENDIIGEMTLINKLVILISNILRYAEKQITIIIFICFRLSYKFAFFFIVMR